MEYIETYKGIDIYKYNGYYKTNINGIDCTDINILKRIIDTKQ